MVINEFVANQAIAIVWSVNYHFYDTKRRCFQIVRTVLYRILYLKNDSWDVVFTFKPNNRVSTESSNLSIPRLIGRANRRRTDEMILINMV